MFTSDASQPSQCQGIVLFYICLRCSSFFASHFAKGRELIQMFAFLPRAHFVGCGPLQRAKSFYFQISSGVAVLCQQFGHEAIWILGSLEIKIQQQNSPSTNHCLYTGKMETSAPHLTQQNWGPKNSGSLWCTLKNKLIILRPTSFFNNKKKDSGDTQ